MFKIAIHYKIILGEICKILLSMTKIPQIALRCSFTAGSLDTHYILWAVCTVAFDILKGLTASISFQIGSFSIYQHSATCKSESARRS